MSKINFADKVATKQSTKPRINSITHEDINEIKASVNDLYDGINLDTSEIDTGKKWVDGSTIYKKTIIYDKTDIQENLSNNQFLCDISSLNAKDVFIDYKYSYIDLKYTNNQIACYPLNNIAIINSAINSIRQYSNAVMIYTNVAINLYIGTNIASAITTSSTGKLYLTIEYTKNL